VPVELSHEVGKEKVVKVRKVGTVYRKRGVKRLGRLTWWDFTRIVGLRRRLSVVLFYAKPGGKPVLKEEERWGNVNGMWIRWRSWGFWFVFRRPTKGSN